MIVLVKPPEYMSEPRPTVSFDAREILVVAPSGRSRRIAWDALTRVCILTLDTGPFVSDVFWAFHVRDEKPLVVTHEAHGTPELLKELQRRLPGFNNDQVIAAMQSVENAEFVVWQPPGG
jgi:hypothetical protein